MGKFHFFSFVILLLIIAVGCTSLETKTDSQSIDLNSQTPLINGLLVGNAPPEFSAQTIDGKVISLDSFGEKPLLIYFFATWCPYCTEDFTTLSSIYSAYESDVHFVAIDMDLGEDENKIDMYRKRFPALTGVIFTQGNIETLSDYQIKYTTTKYAIAGNGTILYAGSGAFSKGQWLTLLDAMRKSGMESTLDDHPPLPLS